MLDSSSPLKYFFEPVRKEDNIPKFMTSSRKVKSKHFTFDRNQNQNRDAIVVIPVLEYVSSSPMENVLL